MKNRPGMPTAFSSSSHDFKRVRLPANSRPRPRYFGVTAAANFFLLAKPGLLLFPWLLASGASDADFRTQNMSENGYSTAYMLQRCCLATFSSRCKRTLGEQQTPAARHVRTCSQEGGSALELSNSQSNTSVRPSATNKFAQRSKWLTNKAQAQWIPAL